MRVPADRLEWMESIERGREREQEKKTRNPHFEVPKPERTTVEEKEEKFAFSYNGFRCEAVMPEGLFWVIKPRNGEELPSLLCGRFIGRERTRQAIRDYLSTL